MSRRCARHHGSFRRRGCLTFAVQRDNIGRRAAAQGNLGRVSHRLLVLLNDQQRSRSRSLKRRGRSNTAPKIARWKHGPIIPRGHRWRGAVELKGRRGSSIPTLLLRWMTLRSPHWRPQAQSLQGILHAGGRCHGDLQTADTFIWRLGDARRGVRSSTGRGTASSRRKVPRRKQGPPRRSRTRGRELRRQALRSSFASASSRMGRSRRRRRPWTGQDGSSASGLQAKGGTAHGRKGCGS